MVKAGIVGGTGYTGVELLRLLAQHPQIELTAVTSRQESGLLVAQIYPSLRGRVDIAFTDPDPELLKTCDVVFFATPHGVAMANAPALVNAGTRVIDLAADFRLKDTAMFERWYKMSHSCPELLEQSVYGLPEINRNEIANAMVVGMPGCYPTSVQLALAPVLESGADTYIDPGSIIADCKSGVSGAGRKAAVNTLFAEAGDNFCAYGVSGHRHWPEIEQTLTAVAGAPVKVTFVPHLLPIVRGIHSTIYARLTAKGLTTDFQSLFEKRYKDEPFIDVMPAGSMPQTRSVRASNMLRLAVHRPPESDLLMLLVVEDNLVKGASGQAVQAMNIMFNLDETTGLTQIPVLP
jgi:N-acetyl-gamma-glutamyl-phosphate reductase